MDLNDIILAIQDGKFDDDLQELSNEIFSRRTILNNRKAREMKRALKVGDRVITTGTLKPKYLNYKTGVVEELRDGRALVKLDCGPIGKFRTGKVLFPYSCLEVR